MTFRDRFLEEISTLGLPTQPGALPAVTETDISPLPEPAQRYLRFMGVVGRPRDWSFRLGFTGRFQVNRGAPWRPCEVWQFDTSPVVSRTFFMKMRFGGLPVIGRDSYRDGHGHMLGKLLDLFTVIDGSGTEYDISELVTYLDDLVLMAPSMLLVPAVSFSAVEERSFDVALTDHGQTVRGRVFLDEQAAPVSFETADRFCEDPAHPKQLLRARWSTPTAGFERIDGRLLPRRAQAMWHLPDGDQPYADFSVVPGSVAFNVPAGE
ncbi:MAG: hypothetical protein JW940_20225 [Polyangiaceae bacterium]|nr:hypothetical protein [Polyangiaceae bacterium]